MNASYTDATCEKMLISVEGKYAGYFYLVDWNEEKPLEAFPAPKSPTKYLRFQNYEDYLLVGFSNGTW
jgi:hypothetical protein